MKHSTQPTRLITLSMTILALIAFAANSVLGRLALTDSGMDANSFTALRLISGGIMLGLILFIRSLRHHFTHSSPSFTPNIIHGSWFSCLLLCSYAWCFSIAYQSLDTGIGALILFGAVQITMIVVSLIRGASLSRAEWLGMLLASSGFIYLMLPSVSAPSLSGFILMTIAGISWAGYTLRGKGISDPLADTAGNFIRSIPLVCLLLAILWSSLVINQAGIWLAIASGAITSGCGYTIWYVALRGLSATQAGVVQLLVPVVAALGGMIFIAEPISLDFILASLLILGGILLAIKKPTS